MAERTVVAEAPATQPHDPHEPHVPHEPDEPRLSRRGLIGSAAALAGLWSMASQETAHAAPPAVAADVDPGALLPKLVRRITLGLTPAELTLAQNLGYDGYLEYHLNHAAIPEDANLTTRLSALTTLNMIPLDLFPLQAGQVIGEISEAQLLRAILSKRQLFERMVEFWTDHFNIDITKGDDRYLKTYDDRTVIRPFALDTFPNLLNASAHSTAMLYYLDNTGSIAGNANENYARELLELHTLGADGGYTQTDVEQVARCLTGWTMWGRGQGANTGTFRYDANRHDTGQKIVLGHVIPARSAAAGIQDGVDVLNILIDHPNTARYLATKMCRWFLSENPPTSVINAVAGVYTATRGDIKAMLREVLKANVVAEAPLKYKRPFHMFVSGLRAVNALVATTSAVRTQLTGAGHQQFYWPTPDGYPDKVDFWGGFILPRWNFAASMMNSATSQTAGGINGVTVDHAAFFAGATTADAMADRINTTIFAGELPTAERNRLRDYLLPNAPTTLRQREALGLALSTPSFQWY